VSDWQEFDWQTDEPDPRRDRLCSNNHPRRPVCRIEGANLASGPAEPKGELVVWAYNVERGIHLDQQLRALHDSGMPPPDILLLSEADRGCTRTRYRNVAREWARALGMYYVYGAEFVELPRLWEPSREIIPLQTIWRRCEHGNAILSRYPLGNVRLIRHRESRAWNDPVQRFLHLGEPRLGGRMALAADVRIGDRLLRVYSVHFESGPLADHFREAEVRELIGDATIVTHGVMIGGDMNCGHYISVLKGEMQREPVTSSLLGSGYSDAHSHLPVETRITTASQAIIDLLFGRGVEFLDGGVAPHIFWAGLSDHYPVWSRVRLVR
jgi:endonuclease/exonuclease/phosphatase family metal-dependent hydrolase